MTPELQRAYEALAEACRPYVESLPSTMRNGAIQNALALVDRLIAQESKTEAPAVPRGHCNRCDRCGWPLNDSWTEGCCLNNCSERPLPPRRTHCLCGAPYEASP